MTNKRWQELSRERNAIGYRILANTVTSADRTRLAEIEREIAANPPKLPRVKLEGVR